MNVILEKKKRQKMQCCSVPLAREMFSLLSFVFRMTDGL